MRFGPLGRFLAPLLLWQLPLHSGIQAHELRPLAEIQHLGTPVRIIAGTEDQHTTLTEGRDLFRAAREPKEFWAIEAAGHEDLHLSDPEAYESRVLGFLARHLHTNS